MNSLRKLIKETLERIQEEISASEAHGDIGAIQTLIDGKRNIAFITLPSNYIINMINDNKLLTKRVPSNPHMAFIVYKPGSKKEALELFNIAEKYHGFLSVHATDDDTRRIGKLLGYKDSDVEDHIKNKRRNEIGEDINVPINVGDEVLGGKFKNKKITVKDIGKNEKGDITINSKPLLRFRIKKDSN